MELEKRGVKVVNSCLVRPELETPKHGLWLSNLDLMTISRAHAPTIYIYRRTGDSPADDFFSAERLKTALGRALVPFYPLSGRLGVDRTGRLEVDCNSEGVVFIEAESDSAVDDFGDFLPSADLRRMFVPSVDSEEAQRTLLLLQVTTFRCGGVCLGVAFHHTVVDGLGALHFINTWSDISRRGGAAAGNFLPPVVLDRHLLRSRSPPVVLFDHPEYRRRTSQTQDNSNNDSASNFTIAALHLTKQQLDALKGAHGRRPISTFKATVAHVWRCTCEARGLAGDESTRLHVTADARTRLVPPLPTGFIGNAVFRTSVAAMVGDILTETLADTGRRVEEATATLGDEYVRSLVDHLEVEMHGRNGGDGDNDDGSKQKTLPAKKGESSSWRLPRGDVWVVSWLGLPVYAADFGWGPPAVMRRATLNCSGSVYLMRRPPEDGGISLVLSLEEVHMATFEKLFYGSINV